MKRLKLPLAELEQKIAPIRKKMELEATSAPIAIYRKMIRINLPHHVPMDE